MRCKFLVSNERGNREWECALDCLNIGQENSEGEVKRFCCMHVPEIYVNSPMEEWICELCDVRRNFVGDDQEE